MTLNFGITLHAGAYIESVRIDRKKEIHTLKGSTGDENAVHENNPTADFTVKGHGTLSVVPGIGSIGITSLTGGVIAVKKVGEGEKNDGWSEWDYDGTHYPNAVQV